MKNVLVTYDGQNYETVTYTDEQYSELLATLKRKKRSGDLYATATLERFNESIAKSVLYDLNEIRNDDTVTEEPGVEVLQSIITIVQQHMAELDAENEKYEREHNPDEPYTCLIYPFPLVVV